jgi:superfamily II DNA or RNA helicase
MRTYGTITADGRFWAVTGEPHVILRLKRVFGQVKAGAQGTIRLSNTPETCRDLLWFCDRFPMTIDPAALAGLTAGATRHRETILRLEQLLDTAYTPPAFKLALPARDYQAREAAVLLENQALLIGDDVGLGKTAAAICAFTDPRTLPAVVVTLTHLPWQWSDEIGKFAPDLQVHIIKKGTPYPLPTFMGHGPDVVVLNYHKLSGWAQTLGAYARTVVFDEVQELRHNGSNKYMAAQHLAEQATFRVGLSATPIYNYGGEIFFVLDVLKPGGLGSFAEFCTEWCHAMRMDGKVSLRDPKAFGSYLREHFLMIRHTRQEVGRELPEVVKVPHRISSDRTALDRVESNATELARIILARTDRAQGAVWQASEQLSVLLRQATGIAKAPYVADFVRLLVESGEKVVLCGWHREVYGIWREKLRDLHPAFYTGTETPAEKDAAKARFTDGQTDLLILSLRSGAGMNGLQEVSSVIVFGELDWSPGVHEQCIGRLHRDGQAKSVIAYFLMADDGADPAIAEVLGLKREQIEGIRNPHQTGLERLEAGGDHARRLAEAYLRQRGLPAPTASSDEESAA